MTRSSLVRMFTDTAGTHTHRWTPRSVPSSAWQALPTPVVVPTLAEVLWAWCRSSPVLTLLSLGVPSFLCPSLGLPSSDGISVPPSDPTKLGSVLGLLGSRAFATGYGVFLFLSSMLPVGASVEFQ